MIEEKWPTSNPDFYKLGIDKGKIITIKGNINLKEDFFNYALKFKRSAHILTEYVLETQEISKLDNYFFSLAFLYRHSLELILKAIGFKYIFDSEDRRNFLRDTFHNLLDILKFITPYIKDCVTNNRAGYTWLESIFENMNKTDKESDSFRYPFGITIKKEVFFAQTLKQYGIKSFIDKQKNIDLVRFANKMEIAFDILESYFSELIPIKEHYRDYNPILLEEGGSYYGQSVLGYSYNKNRFYPYVRAYTESADYFYERLCNDYDLKEVLFIPMCYLYRNGIELAMKEILFEECSYNFQDTIKLIKKHSIFSLWKTIKDDVIRHSNAPEDDNTIHNVEKYVNQLHDIDGTSDKFRYPTNKYLDLHFKKAVRLDVQNIAKFFGDFAAFLSAVCTQMSAQNEMQAEIEAEYRSEIYFDDY